MAHAHDSTKVERPFSLSLFVVTIILTLLALLGLLALIAPAVWKVQIEAPWMALVVTILLMHLFNSFIEYIFHRYVLHAPCIPFLTRFWKRHEHHHGLTRVKLRQPAKTSTNGERLVENLYPILEEKQYDASFFPWYSLFGFALVATPILIVFQWLLPKAPIFLGGYLAVALSLALYEILHAIEHLPLEKWQPLLDHPRFGNFWKKVYAFHLRHHADKKSNESISGFFGLPIPDFVFRTWVNPMTLYEHGKPNSEQEFSSPRPVFLIRWLDTLAEFRKRRFKEAQR